MTCSGVPDMVRVDFVDAYTAESCMHPLYMLSLMPSGVISKEDNPIYHGLRF